MLAPLLTMVPGGNSNKPLGEQRSHALVRRFAHDVRNELNALEMEAALLGELVVDPEAAESLRRVRKQSAQIEALVLALKLRFSVADRSVVPAVDVFNLWRSRVTHAVPEAEAEWICGANSEAVELDMRMVADALSELLLGCCRSGPVRAAVRPEGAGVAFEIEWDHCGVAAGALVPALPEFETVIDGNGGRVTLPAPPEATRAVCWFPAVED